MLPSGFELPDEVDAVFVGGGFFSLFLAEHLARKGLSVLVCEASADCMLHASFVNQARVHQGYHYPRSLLTALRSRRNFRRFCDEFPESVRSDFTKLYAVGRLGSLVTARQFAQFCRRIGAPLEPLPARYGSWFDRRFVDDAFVAQESAFDADTLRSTMLARAAQAGVVIATRTTVTTFRREREGLAVTVARDDRQEGLRARHVFNCTYAGINRLLDAAGIARIPLNHELAEVALVDPPAEVARAGITVMCGPFFSTMPFPARGCHSLTHVR